jgi:hypothetical protein
VLPIQSERFAPEYLDDRLVPVVRMHKITALRDHQQPGSISPIPGTRMGCAVSHPWNIGARDAGPLPPATRFDRFGRGEWLVLCGRRNPDAK